MDTYEDDRLRQMDSDTRHFNEGYEARMLPHDILHSDDRGNRIEPDTSREAYWEQRYEELAESL